MIPDSQQEGVKRARTVGWGHTVSCPLKVFEGLEFESMAVVFMQVGVDSRLGLCRRQISAHEACRLGSQLMQTTVDNTAWLTC